MRAMLFASVASMVDLFNRDNIDILTDLGYQVTVCANFKEGSVYSKEQAKEFKNELISKGIDVIDVPVPRSAADIFGMINTVRILRDEFLKNDYDILHCQSPIGGVLARIAAMPFRKNGLKVLYFAHGFHFYTGAPTANWLIYYNIEKLCAKITDVILTLNREDYLRARKHFESDIRYIPGAGIDISEINDTICNPLIIREEFNIEPDKKILLSVCELSERKNCLTMIKAFIASGRTDSVLVLCGIGEQMDMLKEYVKNNHAEDRIIFAGFRNDIINMFKASDMFIFTSKQEGLPVALMQAMACGLPVLCSDIRGNSDLMKNGYGGYMYDPLDTRGFAEGINKILDSDTSRMSAYNQKRIKKYDIRAVNTVIENIYRELS